jgi:hypothetical protein
MQRYERKSDDSDTDLTDGEVKTVVVAGFKKNRRAPSPRPTPM